jgi:hypothetical protein
MPATEQEQTNGSGHATALKAAAAAAATGVATIAVRKAMSHGGGSSSDEGGGGRRSSSSILSSAGAGAWDAASDALLPLAENAADAAGRYLAQKAPSVVRERLVPRFIDAFKEGSDGD